MQESYFFFMRNSKLDLWEREVSEDHGERSSMSQMEYCC
jgi:hypothetical protein